jgi:protein gp37
MGANSAIEWCDHTFNPWMGCTRVSEGCVHCYAESFTKRFKKADWGPTAARVRTSEAYWKKPLAWNKETWRECLQCGYRGAGFVFHEDFRADQWSGWNCSKCGPSETMTTRQRVFCASMADVFEDNKQVANWRGELFKLIEATPNLDWLILTKRPERIFSLGTDAVGEIFDLWLARQNNVWLGTSVENQKTADERTKWMGNIGASVRFLSVEPLLEEIYIRDLLNIDWVIVGGESGAGCRPFNVEWARIIHEQCKEKGVPFFMKQLGGHPKKRDRLEDLPVDLRVREMPTPPLAPPQKIGEGD